LTVSPAIAAMINNNTNSQTFIEPSAANVPAANSNESPGKNGVMTNPVSIKITAKKDGIRPHPILIDDVRHVFIKM